MSITVLTQAIGDDEYAIEIKKTVMILLRGRYLK